MTRERYDLWKHIQAVLDGTAPSADGGQTQQQQTTGGTPQQRRETEDAAVDFMMSLPASEIAKLPEAMRERFRKAVSQAYITWQREGR
jgi:hypothetical protein